MGVLIPMVLLGYQWVLQWFFVPTDRWVDIPWLNSQREYIKPAHADLHSPNRRIVLDDVLTANIRVSPKSLTISIFSVAQVRSSEPWFCWTGIFQLDFHGWKHTFRLFRTGLSRSSVNIPHQCITSRLV